MSSRNLGSSVTCSHGKVCISSSCHWQSCSCQCEHVCCSFPHQTTGPDKPGFAQQAWSPAQRRHSYLLNDGCRNAAWQRWEYKVACGGHRCVAQIYFPGRICCKEHSESIVPSCVGLQDLPQLASLRHTLPRQYQLMTKQGLPLLTSRDTLQVIFDSKFLLRSDKTFSELYQSVRLFLSSIPSSLLSFSQYQTSITSKVFPY